jgi:hypothetical protein
MRITITAGANTYLIAGESHAHADGNFQGRLLNEINLSEALNTVGAMPVTLNLSIRNDDGYILRSVDLWAAMVEIEADGGQAWAGKITAYDNDSDGVLRVVATERAAPEIEMQIPDEVARLVTVDENFHTSAVNVTLPLVIGGTVAAPHLIKGILIDKTQGIYLLCVGEIHQVVKVYRGTEELSTGYDAYTGTALQVSYAGIAYVQITDEDLLFNDDGSYAEISTEVVGVKLGASTIEECRNGARFLQYLLTTAATGACGWGLGIAEADIDTDSFTTAISRLDTAALKLDGVFYFRQSAQSWIDQICQSIRGSYSIGADSKRRLFVNASGSSVKTYDESNMRVLRDGKGAYTGRVYNKGKLDYGYNPITGQFMQSAFYEDATSIAAIGEQEFYGQSYLIKDATTAQAILEYNCKKSLIGADRVLFETDELAEGCRVGDIITLAHTTKGLTGTYQITSLEIGDYLHTIEAERYSTDIFTVGAPGTAIDWATDAPISSSILPGNPSGLNLSTVVDYDSDGDGAARPWIEGTFTPPEGKYLGAAVFWGEGEEPATWNAHGSIRGTTFRVGPVKAGQLYTVKVQLFNSSGASTAITGSIVGGSHTELPPAPTVTVSSGLGCVVVNISVSAFSALAGFDIQRQTSAGADETTIVSSFRGTKFTDDSSTILDAYGTYQYRVRSVSNSRQTSAWSAWTSDVGATQAQSKDITANQIIAKDFRTACNVGAAQNGVMFNCAGLQAWCDGTKTVDIPTSGSPSFAGTITAAAGNIGGWNIGTDRIYCQNADKSFISLGGWVAGGGYNNSIFVGTNCDLSSCGLISIGGCLRISSGWTNLQHGISIVGAGAAQMFRATHDRTTGDNFCGVLAGWNFNAACIWSNNILMNAAGCIQTADFVTGNCGWKIDCIGNAEFNNVCARGAIRTAVFIKDEISVVGGCTMIRPAGVSAYDCCPAADTFSIYVNDSVDQFAINDLIRLKDDTNDFWGRVCACGCNGKGCYVTFVKCSGTRFNFTKGQALVNYGSCAGCGGIMLNGQAPYIDLYTHDGTPWNGTDSRMRIGNLDGWGTDFCTGDYGWVAGCPTGQRAFYTPRTGMCVIGNISACSGNIGGWCISAEGLFYVNADSSFIALNQWPAEGGYTGGIFVGANYAYSACGLISMGSCLRLASGFTGLYSGISIIGKGETQLFRATADRSTGSNFCGILAGWNFNSACLWSGNLIMNSAGSIAGNYAAGSAGWCISCTGAAEFNNVTVRGIVCASSGSIGGFCIWSDRLWIQCSDYSFLSIGGWPSGGYNGSIYVGVNCANSACGLISMGSCLRTAAGWVSTMAGISIVGKGETQLFRATADRCTGANFCGILAGWNFNAACLYSGALVINSAGSITGNYTAGSAGWCISCSGAAEFNCVTVRGTICSSSGTIGGMGLDACGIGLGDLFTHPKYGSNYRYGAYLTQGYCNGSYDTGLNIILACADACSVPPWKMITCISISGSTGSGYDTSNPASSNAPITICTMSTSYYAFATNSRIVASAFCVVSDRAIKTDIQRVSVLSALRQMPVTKWRFCDSPDYQIGPMAQDFNCVFQLSHDWQTNLTVGGLDGIALRGVQELDECVAYNNRRILDLESRNACLETQINCITKELLQLKAA